VVSRPVIRSVFLRAERMPSVIFFTSSNDKFTQARLVFMRFGLPLRHSRDRLTAEAIPYAEDYSSGQEDLLSKAISEIRRRGGSNGSYFFIEDTTIRIEALSGNREFPGLRAKEWFQETSFDELDLQLSEAGDRRASVRSTIALWVPGLDRHLVFTGETEGEVANTPPDFEVNPTYPWLTPHNFNGWLIPRGARSRLGEMSFEESWNHDFRVQALEKLVDRLEEYAIALNAPPQLIQRRVRTGPQQEVLFDVERPLFVVVGPTCSGKTTFADYASGSGYAAIDASSVVRGLALERTGKATDTRDFARKLLKDEGPDVVARKVSSLIGDNWGPRGIIITGFRAIEEIEHIRSTHRNVIVVSVEAEQRIRFNRYLRRGTRRQLDSFDDFRQHDEEQYQFGLLEVAGELADVRIENVHSLHHYQNQVEYVMGLAPVPEASRSGPPNGVVSVRPIEELEHSQLYRCLVVLKDEGRPLTTQEISRRLPADKAVRFNNANKMLKRYPALAARFESREHNVRYQVTSSGLAYLRALESRASRRPRSSHATDG
jgi:inosine/xanthosine triphosphate pyrophosphatase family protein/dephospho-CoA kinase